MNYYIQPILAPKRLEFLAEEALAEESANLTHQVRATTKRPHKIRQAAPLGARPAVVLCIRDLVVF